MIYRAVFVRFYDIKYYSSILAIGMENCRLLGNCTTEFACFWTPLKISIALSKPGFTKYSIVLFCPAINELLITCLHEKRIPKSRFPRMLANQISLFFSSKLSLVKNGLSNFAMSNWKKNKFIIKLLLSFVWVPVVGLRVTFCCNGTIFRPPSNCE